MKNKTFTMGQILSVASGIFCTENFGDVYEILNYMSGEDLYTTQLPRVANEATPYLLDRFEWLEDACELMRTTEGDGAAALAMAKTLANRYGNNFSVPIIPMDDHEIVDPGEDARRLGFKGEIIDIDLSDEDDNEISPYGDINWND